jgi:hypothetical protein
VSSIEKELALAKQAKAAIEELGSDAVEVLRRAVSRAGIAHATVFSSAGSLDNARYNVVVALVPATQGLELNRPDQVKIDTAKAAIEAWIKELEAAEP